MKLLFENEGTVLSLKSPKPFDETIGADFLALASKAFANDHKQAAHPASRDDFTASQPQEHDNFGSEISYKNVPGWREPVKTKVMCPYCGEAYTKEVPYGYKYIRCQVCKQAIHLKAAAGEFGVPDEKGFYYIAESPLRTEETIQEDQELLKRMENNKESAEG